MSTKIVLYDDNDALRHSLEELIADTEELQLLAAFSNAETVLKDIQQLKPDVIFMDIDMPTINGVQAVRTIRTQYETLPIIMLTVFDDNDNIFNAICAGASGYILKRHAYNEIPNAVRDVMSGGAPMTGSVARKVLQMLPVTNTVATENVNLSDKETQILQLLVQGFSYKMISNKINISIDTVRFHIKKIYDKLHVHSATEAVSKALKNKLV